MTDPRPDQDPKGKAPPAESERSGDWLLRLVAEATRDVPDEEWASLPRDLSKNLDHYLYGVSEDEEE